MKRVFILVVTAALTACAAVQSQPDATVQTTAASGLSNAEILYGYRCKGCHEPATPGAPDREELANFEAREIIDALRKGPMKPLATGLTKEEIRELAAFLSNERSSKRK